MIKPLQDMKDKGANYVSLNYHEGHIGYQISGYLIRESTTEEIQNYEFKRMSKENKDKKIQELQKEIQRICQS